MGHEVRIGACLPDGQSARLFHVQLCSDTIQECPYGRFQEVHVIVDPAELLHAFICGQLPVLGKTGAVLLRLRGPDLIVRLNLGLVAPHDRLHLQLEYIQLVVQLIRGDFEIHHVVFDSLLHARRQLQEGRLGRVRQVLVRLQERKGKVQVRLECLGVLDRHGRRLKISYRVLPDLRVVLVLRLGDLWRDARSDAP
jgi:hypothetical protein